MEHVMVDIETMGRGPTSAIVAIGACFFDPASGEIGQTFECTINLKSSELYGDMDPDTVLWWLDQCHEARQELVTAKMSLFEGLRRFWHFVTSNADIYKVQVWANAPSFDLMILKHAITTCLEESGAPWQFYNEKCCRTITYLCESLTGVNFKEQRKFEGEAHTALADALHQAGYVSDAYMALEKLKN